MWKEWAEQATKKNPVWLSERSDTDRNSEEATAAKGGSGFGKDWRRLQEEKVSEGEKWRKTGPRSSVTIWKMKNTFTQNIYIHQQNRITCLLYTSWLNTYVGCGITRRFDAYFVTEYKFI